MKLLALLVIWGTVTELQCGVLLQSNVQLECKGLECPSNCTIIPSSTGPCPECDCDEGQIDLPIIRLKRSKESFKCKIAEFSTKYLNSKSKIECEESSEEDEDLYEDNDKEQESVDNFEDMPLTNCKLRKFLSAYKGKVLNEQTRVECTEKEEEEEVFDENPDSQDSQKHELPKGCKLRKFTNGNTNKNINTEFKIVCEEEDGEE